MPLNTRLGVAQAPIAPGERCLRCDAVAGAQPREPVALHHAAKPLPFDTADDVDVLADGEDVGRHQLADVVGAGVVGAQLDQVARGLHPGLVEVAPGGLVDVRGASCP